VLNILLIRSPNWVIFESLDMQSGGLQMFFDPQKWRSNAENTGRGWVISLLQILLEKIALDPLSSFSLISFSFLVCFEWFKMWWVCEPRLYKMVLYCWKRQAKGYTYSLSFRSRGTMHEDSISFDIYYGCQDLQKNKRWKTGFPISLTL
jgi:hypothetical protein